MHYRALQPKAAGLFYKMKPFFGCPSRCHLIALVCILVISQLGCQTTRGKAEGRQQARQQKLEKQKSKRAQLQQSRGRRAKAQQFSLYDRKDLDYKLLRRGQRQRHER